MKNFSKGKFGTIVIILVTVILAGVAVFTALRLYQLRTQPVAPNVPSSIPHAQTVGNCTLSFTLSTSTSSPTPTVTPTGSPGETPTPTPTGSSSSTPSPTPNSCGGTCGSNQNCASGYFCNTSVGFCRNPSCPAEADCNCTGQGTLTPAPTTPSLPKSGTSWPTVAGAGIGFIIIIGSLLLAL